MRCRARDLKCVLRAVLLIFWGVQRTIAADEVVLQQLETGKVEIRIDGQPFATYNHGPDLPKPFLLPVRSASGVVINRDLGDPTDSDHPHHKGMWNSVDEVNGIRFWAEKGPIRNESVNVIRSGDATAAWTVVNQWRHPENGEIQLTEAATVTVHANRLLVYDMTFTASSVDVTIEDTKEGMFGFRVAPSMKEKNGGRVVASDGTETTANCWGKPFPWIDYYGTVDGQTVGVAIMDHPQNFRPSRYHVRDYGLFSISPFGEKAYTNGANEAAPLHLKKGASIRLRYAIYFHDGDTGAANVAGAYDQFVKTSRD